jgi:hypothetical protein
VAQMVEAPPFPFPIFHWYKPSGCTMALRLTQPLNRNNYQKYFIGDKGGRCAGLTTLPPSCADRLEIWEPRSYGTLSACPGLYRDGFTFNWITVLEVFRPFSRMTLISDCVVGILNALPTGQRRMLVQLPAGSEVFLFNKTSGLALGPTLLPVQLVLEACSPGHDSGSLSSASVEVKNEWSHTFTPLHGVYRNIINLICSIKFVIVCTF